mmetsp:Transcript_21611/g.21263  ORF Transcript_21611/g.21263 Transcript_21611/m.21263 type:complete len:168 (+) Transcript_21611:447-950(+)
MEYLAEWYIWAELKRIDPQSRPIISEKMKQEYVSKIQEQEFEILSELNFDVEVELPNKYIAKFFHVSLSKRGKPNEVLSKHAYMFMNDAFTTTAPLFYPPQEIAAAVIYMADVYLKKSPKFQKTYKDKCPSNEEEWFKFIDETLDLKTIIEVKDEIKKCYDRKTSSS